MPVITPASTTASGTAVPLDRLVDALIGESVTILSTAGIGVVGFDTAHDVSVLGIVQGAAGGISLGDSLAGSLRNTVTVDKAGLVQATQAGADVAAITLISAVSTVTNAGIVRSAANGIALGGISEGGSLVANYGLIDADGIAILRNIGSSERMTVLNLGIVQANFIGGRIAYQGGALIIAVDVFVNRGQVIGNINLGGGNDFYDGRKGIMEGTVYGGNGNDVFYAGRLPDVFDGEGGSDTVDFGHLGAVTVALDGFDANTGYAENDTYNSIENLRGSLFGADSLRGNADRNQLFGNGGADTLNGVAGDDRLIGGAGRDVLTGGAGNDVFIYNSAAEGGDLIVDFTLDLGNNDEIWINARGFGGGLKAGEVLPQQFHLSTTNRAGDRDDRFIFQTVGAKLWFDKDGTGRARPVLIADLTDTIELSDIDLYLI